MFSSRDLFIYFSADLSYYDLSRFYLTDLKAVYNFDIFALVPLNKDKITLKTNSR